MLARAMLSRVTFDAWARLGWSVTGMKWHASERSIRVNHAMWLGLILKGVNKLQSLLIALLKDMPLAPATNRLHAVTQSRHPKEQTWATIGIIIIRLCNR